MRAAPPGQRGHHDQRERQLQPVTASTTVRVRRGETILTVNAGVLALALVVVAALPRSERPS